MATTSTIEMIDTGPGVRMSLQGFPPTLADTTPSTVTVTVTWDTVKQDGFPSSTKPGGFQVTLTGGGLSAPAKQTVPASPATFPNMQQGGYTASVQAVDTKGQALGAPATSKTVSIDVPTNVNVSVG